MVEVTKPGGRMETEGTGIDWEPTRVPVYAVVRFDPSRSGVEHQVMIWEVLADIEEAEADVEHLNAQVPPGHSTMYFIEATCFYPEGRRVPRGPWGRRPERPRKPLGPPAPRERIEEEWGSLFGPGEGDDQSDSSA
jgi:hypothetical protein